MALSDFQKQLLTSAETLQLYKQMQNDAMQLSNTVDFLRTRLERYAKISPADATTHLAIPSEIVTTLSSFRNLLSEFLEIYDGTSDTRTIDWSATIDDMKKILR